jgi:arylsulfatase
VSTVSGLPARLTIATGFALLGLGAGVAGGLRDGVREVEAQRYADLEFTRNGYLELARFADAGLAQGIQLALLYGGAAFALVMLGLLVAPLRFEPERLMRAFRGPLGPALGLGLTASIALGGLWFTAAEKGRIADPFLLPSDLQVAILTFVLGAGWVAGAVWIARLARSDADPQVGSLLRAYCVGGLVLVAGGYWLNRSVWTPPRDDFVLLRNLTLLVVAAALYLFERRRPLLWRLVMVSAALIALIPFGVRSLAGRLDAPTLAAERPLNVVVIALDTVRADHTSIVGNRPMQRDTTPNLRALAERSVNFRRAITQAPWTIPAFASVLTGLYPHEHGALELHARLPREHVTLAEILREAGYETYGVVSHMFLQEFRGFRQGYDRYDEGPTQGEDVHRSISSEAVTESALGFLEEEHERPFFLFAHYFDPHYEYRDHKPWRLASGYDGWFREQLDFENLLKNGHLLRQEDLKWLYDLYHEELLFTDVQVGRVLDQLEESGLMENTLVVVVADHGEEFREHGGFGHTTSLHQEVLHVPLIVAAPELADGVEVDVPVETRAVFGTVLRRVGVLGEDAGTDTLLRFVDGGVASVDGGPHRAFSSVWLGNTDPRHGKRFQKASMVQGDWKVIYDMTQQQTLLYDLARDPRESRRSQDLERAKAMRKTLDAWISRMQHSAARGERAPLDAKSLEWMRDLGYAGAEEKDEDEETTP